MGKGGHAASLYPELPSPASVATSHRAHLTCWLLVLCTQGQHWGRWGRRPDREGALTAEALAERM
jgi:hypothetical protein